MKTTFLTLTAALILSFGLSSCDRDGNTGNGANDPTSKFESDKTIKAGGEQSGTPTDTASKETTTLTTVDTTMVEGRHK